jgi:DNA-binding beta-propeller fold protein YncE
MKVKIRSQRLMTAVLCSTFFAVSLLCVAHAPVANSESLVSTQNSKSLNSPEAVVAEGANVWVASAGRGNPSVSEFSIADGRLTREVTSKSAEWSLPNALASTGGDLWVSQGNGNAVAEVKESSGKIVRIVSRANLNEPNALASFGSDLWVATNTTIDELSARTGAVERTLSGHNFQFGLLNSIAVSGGRVWVVDAIGNSLDEIDASTGVLVRRVKSKSLIFDGYPSSIALSGENLWVANGDASSLIEISATSGKVTRVLKGSVYDFNHPAACISVGSNLWVADVQSNAVTIINEASGHVLRILKGRTYGFKHPVSMTEKNGDIWIANATGNFVTELQTNNYRVVRILKA